MLADELQSETSEVLSRLVRANTVNPPGNEREAIEYLAGYVREAGFTVQLPAAEAARPNLVADLHGEQDGPTLCLLGHVDTVLAHPEEWRHDPWSGEVIEGELWGRGALDMKSQVAAEAVAAVSLARQGWRPAAGHLKLVFVADEETGGDVGARWLCEQHPDLVRCDYLLNEGAGAHLVYGDRRLYGVCCAEKGIFRFRVTARGRAGHASMPRTGDNALLKLGPVLQRIAQAPPAFELTEAPAAFLRALGENPDDPAGALARLGQASPGLLMVAEPMLEVTLTPTMAHASDKINVIPSSAWLKVDCRVPPGLGEEAARRRIAQVIGDEFEIEFTEQVIGNASPIESPLRSAIDGWVAARDPGAETVPVILPGFSDSRWFREAFPECVAYGFFPQCHMNVFQSTPLIHSADERIDVRDLGFAAACYADVARELLGSGAPA